MRKFANYICKHQKLVIFISCILLVLSFIGMNLTKINYDILVYLPEDIETIKGENILTDDFEIGSYSLALVENLNSKDILKLEDDIKNIDGVNNVFSIYDAIGTSIPLDMLPSDITNKVHNENTDLLIITFAGSTSNEKTINAVKEIRELKGDYLKQGGMSSMVVDTMNLSESEIFIYIVIAVILCIFILELSLDSYVVPFILLINIGFAILFNLGTNVFLGEISYITKALVAVLQLGVTTDFSIFLYHSYEKKKEAGLEKTKAMRDAIVDTFTSVTGSSLTTIVGFLVLCTMQLTLGKDLGIVMAKGVLFGVICVLTLFPALLLMLDNLITKTKHKVIVPNYTKLNTFIIKHKNIIFAIFVILLIPIYLAYSKVDVYYKLDRSLPSYLESIKTNQELKDNYNIVSPELILVDSSLKTDDFNNLVQQIEATDGIEWVLSLAKLNELGISKNMLSDEFLKIVENENYDLVLVNSSYETATDELNNQITEINKIVKSYDKNGIVAGEGALMKDLVTICDTDFHNVNTSSIICIFVILFFVLKSLSLPFLLIITIEFAIFMNMSFSYFGGVTLPFIAPIVLGTIQLGATIDYAILMTTTYLRKRKEKAKEDAMLEAMNYCGNSIFTSGMCFFAATFGVGIYSKIEMIGALCTLIARGAIISMLVVIMVLPSILLIFDKLILKTTLKERKDKKMKNSFKKKVVATLSLLLIFGFTFNPVFVSALTKNETVYAKLNEDGTVKSILVSEELKNTSKKEKLEDYTTITNILNVSNDSTFKQDGNKLTWNADGKDIFYQGTTEEKLPISLDITYKLNNKETKVDDMLGKSGKVEITLKFTNHDKHNGLYTPFVITTGMILDNENNSNIKVENGKVITNGTKNIIVGISSPGLYESLKIKELKGMDKITISYETTKFELASIYNVITPKLIENSDLDVFTKMDTIYESVDTLGSNMDKIDSASKEVANGSKVLKSSLESAISKLKESSSENTLSKDKIKEKALLIVQSPEYEELLKNKVDDIIASNDNSKVTNSIVQNIVEYLTKSNQEAKIPTFMSCLQNQKQAICRDVANELLLTEQMGKVVLDTSKKAGEKVAIDTASSVVDSLVPTLANQVKSTTINTLTNSLGTLYTGIDKLDSGITELSKGISTFNAEGIKKITNLVNSKVKGTASKVKELIKLSNNYDSFTTSHNLKNSSTKFILVIDGKNAPKEEKEVKKEDTKVTFWDRVINLFK